MGHIRTVLGQQRPGDGFVDPACPLDVMGVRMARLIGVCCNNEFHSRTTNLSARHANPHRPASAERIIA